MIKAVVFDCFGVVLADSLSEIRAGLAQRDPKAAEEVRDIIAANNRGLLEPQESNARIAAILNMDLEAFRTLVRTGEARNTRLLDYILELKGRYKTAMLSNVAGSSLARRFPDNELATYFDTVVASAEIGFAKPDYEAYHITAQRLGVLPEECVFTDDNPTFCEAATQAGMSAIVYTNFVQFQTDLERLLTGTKD